jgi:putative FmdB family regulatory protein
MPTYEYECEKCRQVFEEFQSITAEPLKKCKKEGCDGNVHRLLSAGAGFLFKGSGFYITDYRSDSYKKSARSDTGGPSSAAPTKTTGSTAPSTAPAPKSGAGSSPSSTSSPAKT